jgi:SAM-dependent methyltransferase
MSDTPTAGSYRIGWERYWNSIETRPVEVFWNAEAEEATRDVALFADTLDPNLPLVDIGCGDGVHTRALAALTRFPAVIGVDVAPSAIRRAQAAASDKRLSFRVLDLLRPEQAEALHEEIGDANLHVRGVLHQFPPAGRKIAIESLAKLLGTNGLLYLKELTPRSEAYLANMLNEFGPPSSLGRVMDELFPFHIKWGGLSDLDLKELFPDDSFILLRKGESRVRTTNHLPSGKAIEIPAAYALLRVGLTVSNPTSSYREG